MGNVKLVVLAERRSLPQETLQFDYNKETRFFQQHLRQKSNILSASGFKKPGFLKKPGFWRAVKKPGISGKTWFLRFLGQLLNHSIIPIRH
jgi:hypothetical protein